MPAPPHSTPAPVRPWPWWRRHKIISALLVLAVAAGGLVAWRPWERCGAGMSEAGGQCVGLNLDTTPFSSDPTLNELQADIRKQNDEIKGDDFITVVVLNNMTPDPRFDGTGAALNVQHGIMGAITAQRRANGKAVVGKQTPPVKLLLANYGTGADSQSDAVDEIIKHRDERHIVSVIGLGQSLDKTRIAASTLSRAKIAVVSALASADNMNRDPFTGGPIDRFYRITPTNTDAAKAGVSYLRGRYKNIMLVRDDNLGDSYSSTLGEAFKQAYSAEFPNEDLSEEIFTSPSGPLDGVDRDTYMQNYFDRIYTRMCSEKPGLVYFAGRGIDLKAFLRAVGDRGSCPGMSTVHVLTSDDAGGLLGEPLPEMRATKAEVLYTSVATADMWKGSADQSDNDHQYQMFADAFAAPDGAESLRDGYAMSHHDALLLAVRAARKVANVQENPEVVADWIKGTSYCQDPLLGATGKIAFSESSRGNPIDKALPIMQLDLNGNIEQRDLAWATGKPFQESCR